MLTATLDVAEWEGLANRWGLSVVILALVVVAIYRSAKFAAPLATQAVSALAAFLGEIDNRTREMSVDTKTLIEDTKKTNELLAGIKRELERRP